MKQPLLQDEAFLADVERVRANPHAGLLSVWWLGQSGFLVHWQGSFLLLDPYLSDSLTAKYAASDKPHVRITARVVDPARLDFIDVVTSSHTHTDHLDPETLRPLLASNPRLVMVCPEANRRTVRERSGLPDERIFGLNDCRAGAVRPQPFQPTGLPFRFQAVPAAHEEIERDGEGRLIYAGFVVGAGPYRIYHSGDTVRYEGMSELLRPFAIDLALLPINGRAPERRVAGNLSGEEAAELSREAGVGMAVPCHFDMFEFNTASPDSFAAACHRLGQPFRVLEQGERLDLNSGSTRA